MAGGVAIIEVTLRTPRALDAVAAIAAEVPEIALGVGSVLTAAHVEQALAVGADFLVSPGTSPALLERLVAAPVPVLPGVATVSEVLTALDHGLTELKFFPAGPAGGPAYLAAIGGPVPQVRFCPTGGVTADEPAGLPGRARRGGGRRHLAHPEVADRGRGLGRDHRAGGGRGRRGRRRSSAAILQPESPHCRARSPWPAAPRLAA